MPLLYIPSPSLSVLEKPQQTRSLNAQRDLPTVVACGAVAGSRVSEANLKSNDILPGGIA
jgi:hypothetical protein